MPPSHEELTESPSCSHGAHHSHHMHVHAGVAEGLAPEHVRKLQIVLAISLIYLAGQIAGGYLSGSLALLAEASHKFGDMSAIGLALFAAWFAILPASPRKTFGYGRIEVLAALTNGCVLLFVAGLVILEALQRVTNPHHHHVEGDLMFLVAGIGLILNVISASLLLPAKDKNLNIKGAYFHILADLLGSLGTLVSAGAILWFNFQWADTVISVLIACLVLNNAIRILAEALHILMEAAPNHLSFEKVQGFLQSLPEVHSVHDLHIWTITTGKVALLAHVVVHPQHFAPGTVGHLEHVLRHRFDLCHITLQLEPPAFKEDELPF